MFDLFDFVDRPGDCEDFKRGFYTCRPHEEPPVRQRRILSFFDHTGNWARPYAEAGYDVRVLDIQNPEAADVFEINREWLQDFDLEDAWGILAAVPCTDFAGSGARWFAEKDERGDTEKSVQLMRHMLDIIEYIQPAWWVIENPVGRVNSLVPEMQRFGPWYFQPWEFGDPYTKKTGLWGEFSNNLKKTPVEPTEGSKMWKLPPGPERANLRSATPEGFAKAFFEANP